LFFSEWPVYLRSSGLFGYGSRTDWQTGTPGGIFGGWKSFVRACLLDRPSRWEWQVTSNGEMIANGFEDRQVEAKFEGYNAMFLLLAAGWNP
jgi:hypothetical protein